jgi:hypothetical protein
MDQITKNVVARYLFRQELVNRYLTGSTRVKLTPAQLSLLKELPARVNPDLAPIKKLVELGFAESQSKVVTYSNPTYHRTSAGDEYLSQKK